MRQLRSAIDEAAAAADQDDADSLSRYSDPWKSRFDTITAMDPTLTQGLGDLSPNVKQHFAEELPTLLRDQRPWASNCQIDGGIKQVFFHHLRDVFYITSLCVKTSRSARGCYFKQPKM